MTAKIAPSEAKGPTAGTVGPNKLNKDYLGTTMARAPNAVETEIIKISTTPWVSETLERLARTGRFGKNPSEVADELLRAKLREVELEGWLEKPSSRGGGQRKG
jgi:hypothetical protein